MKKMKKCLPLLFWALCLMAVSASAQTIIKGTVRSATDQSPLEGVSVTVKGNKKGVVTSATGEFSISAKPNDQLIISAIGYTARTITVNASTSKLNIVLETLKNELEDVVVIGYGRVNRKDLTGSVGTVNINDLNKAPVKSFDDALSGRVAGVQVVSPDGQPGAAPTIVIRGGNSVTQDNSPLYVIDGFPIEGFNNNSINPADIESIDILKDASSTAIYGARGANGVIMITTKRGKAGRPIVSYSNYIGQQSNTNRVEVMNAYDYLQYVYEVDTATNSVLYDIKHPTYNPNGKYSLADYANSPSIDWQDEIFQQSIMTNHNVSIKGGSKDTKYTLSGSIFNQTGNIIGSGFKRYQMRSTLDQTINEKIKVGFNANYSYTVTTGSQVGGTYTTADPLLISTWRYRPLVKFGDDLDILLNDAQDEAVVSSTNYQWNPKLTATQQLNDRLANLLTANAFIEYNILPELKFRATAGINTVFTEIDVFNTSLSRLGNPYNTLGNGGPNGSITHNKLVNLVTENTFTYNKIFAKKHLINAVAGFSAGQNTSSSNRFSALKVPNESLGVNGLSQGTPGNNRTTKSSNKLASVLGRINYSYDSRYLATVSFRADGSSKFINDNVWGYFPSGSLAWHLSKEKFLINNKTISDAKIRASYGIIGNNRVSDDAAYSLLNTGATSGGLAGAYSQNNIVINATYPANLANPDLKWESTEETDIGIDFGILNQKITFTADAYLKKTSNLLLYASLPGTSGYTSAYENIGSVENKGIEFSVSSVNIQNKKFSWNTSFNISFNRNKVLSLTSGQPYLTSITKWISGNTIAAAPGFIARVGEPIGMFYGLVSDGVYQIPEFAVSSTGAYTLLPGYPSYSTSIRPGWWKFADQDKNNVIDVNDAVTIGNPNPKFIGGLGNNFAFGNLDLNIFCQFSYGNQIMNINRILMEGGGGGSAPVGANQYASMLNRWTPTNPSNTYAKAGATITPQFYPSRIVEDGSYLRIKTVNIGYRFNMPKLKQIGISNLRVYASGQNLLTFTKYSGLDPEVNSFSSALTPGADYSAYPRAKVITVGLDVSF